LEGVVVAKKIKSDFTDSDLSKYWKGKRKISKLAFEYIEKMDKDEFRKTIQSEDLEIFPTICFSRKIGVGALELAEKLAKQLDYRVVDREIIEHLSDETELSRQSIATFDERYPGIIREFLGRILGDRLFDINEYGRQLYITATFLARMEKTIFVGRGIHLMLPRNRVLAVRCISSMEYRIQHVAKSLKVSSAKARRIIQQADAEQKEFFSRVHGKDLAAPEEFDAILNLDYIQDLSVAADVLKTLFFNRFKI
jgi:cytidylate kinase